VDFCLFVQILEVEEDRIPPELVAAIQSRNPAEIARTLDSLPTLRNIVDDQTNLHESIHIVQGVIYRFLRWYSLAAFQYVSDTFKQMDELTAAAQSVNATSLHSPIFSLLDMEWHIYDMSKRFLFWKYKPALGISITDQVPKGVKAKPLITINTIDLIENAASLLQYKISTGNDFPTWIEFSRWAKRNPAYTRILEFVRDYLGDGNVAVRIFLDLVQVAFDTNRPVQAFAILLAAFKYNYDKGYLDPILAQRGHCRWIEIFDHYAGKMPLEKPEYGNLLSKRFFRIESDLGLRLGGKMTHPILGHFVTKWEKLEANDIAYRYAFGAPNGDSKHISEISELFHAPITLLKLTNEEQNFVSVIGNLRNTGVADADNIDQGPQVGLPERHRACTEALPKGSRKTIDRCRVNFDRGGLVLLGSRQSFPRTIAFGFERVETVLKHVIEVRNALLDQPIEALELVVGVAQGAGPQHHAGAAGRTHRQPCQ